MGWSLMVFAFRCVFQHDSREQVVFQRGECQFHGAVTRDAVHLAGLTSAPSLLVVSTGYILFMDKTTTHSDVDKE